MTAIGKLARDWLPPKGLRWLQERRGKLTRYDAWHGSWTQAQAASTGYDAQAILARVQAATASVIKGEAAYERDSVLFHDDDCPWLILSGLLRAAAKSNGKLNVLDFGGSLGSSYFHLRRLLAPLASLRWNVVEQPHFVELGGRELQDGRLFFYASVEDCLRDTAPNAVLLSSALQYVEDYGQVLDAIARSEAHTLVIDRTPLSGADADHLVIQQVAARIYDASYPMWVFSRQALLARLQPRWRLLASSLSPEGHERASDGQAFAFQGLLLESHA